MNDWKKRRQFSAQVVFWRFLKYKQTIQYPIGSNDWKYELENNRYFLNKLTTLLINHDTGR